MGLGLSIDLDGAAWVEWQRRGLWSAYPDGHLGRLSGVVPLGPGPAPVYRQEPAGGWNTDVWDFFLQGLTPPGAETSLLSNDARGLKENILRFSVGFEGGPERVSVIADGDHAARISGSGGGRLRLIVLTGWDYPDIDWGNYSRPFAIADRLLGRVRLRIIKGR
jgi:beta-galactosidase